MSDATSQTVYFYNRHPISCEIILTKLRASRGHLDALRPEELFPHDQDHYGGLAPPGGEESIRMASECRGPCATYGVMIQAAGAHGKDHCPSVRFLADPQSKNRGTNKIPATLKSVHDNNSRKTIRETSLHLGRVRSKRPRSGQAFFWHYVLSSEHGPHVTYDRTDRQCHPV
jgi:hypothetical protein